MLISQNRICVLALGKKESATSMDLDLAFRISRWNPQSEAGLEKILDEALKAGYVFDYKAQQWKKRTI